MFGSTKGRAWIGSQRWMSWLVARVEVAILVYHGTLRSFPKINKSVNSGLQNILCQKLCDFGQTDKTHCAFHIVFLNIQLMSSLP